MEEKKDSPEVLSVTISDGKVFTKRRAKVKDLTQAEVQPKGKEHEAQSAIIAAKLCVDGRPCVKEDVLELYDDDLELILNALFKDEIEKNA